MTGLHGDGQSRQAVIVLGKDVHIGLANQVLDGVRLSVFRRAHQGGGAIFVTDVEVGPGLNQKLHHVQSAMADGQHQGRLAVLGGTDIDVAQAEETSDHCPMSIVGDLRQGDEHDTSVARLVEDVGVGHFGV